MKERDEDDDDDDDDDASNWSSIDDSYMTEMIFFILNRVLCGYMSSLDRFLLLGIYEARF